jgi:flagellar motor component MotA
MNRSEFVEQYNKFFERAISSAEKARREGLLALEDDLDHGEVNQRDIFQYGMSFVVDGVDPFFIDKILSNIIEQEKDEQMQVLKKIQKEAVLMIQQGANPRLLAAVLNSFTDLPLTNNDAL